MRSLAAAVLLIASLSGCSQNTGGGSETAKGQAAEASVPAYELPLPPYLRAKVSQPFKGDLDALVGRRLIRAAVPFNRTYFFLDGATERGLSYEYLKLYEDKLNESLGKGHPKVFVILLPVPRDRLLSELNAGKVDMAVAQLTITPERLKLADFTGPTRANVSEIPVTGPGSKPVSSVADLAGKTVFIRKSSSYFQSIQRLNETLRKQGRQPVVVKEAPENLEDDDLLEMVNAGLVPATIVDDYLAQFWKKVFPNLVLSEAAPLATGGNLGVAIRKESPKLAASLNGFIGQYGLSSAMGAVLNKRYLQNANYVKDAASDSEQKKFLGTVGLFRKYGQQYDFDYLMMAAQGYQESRLDQNAKSGVGAVGVMQLMPATGKEQGVGDVHQLDPNVHAGVKYMAFLEKQYFANEPMDRVNKELFTFASYNAGPGRIRQLRREAAARGLNPNVWFGNVEQIASEKIGKETVTYVSNIFKYYIAYSLITEEQKRRERSKQAIAKKR
jgi:membrane-bound lytic murein transglycosylase MltF